MQCSIHKSIELSDHTFRSTTFFDLPTKMQGDFDNSWDALWTNLVLSVADLTMLINGTLLTKLLYILLYPHLLEHPP